MINRQAKLNPKIFDADCEKAPIRRGFGEGLVIAGETDKNVVGLCADLSESVQMEKFKNKFPERYVEMGVAEQNMAGVASGMAAMGKIPFMASYAVFSPGRNWEHIRTLICYNNQPVKIVGSHSGVSVGADGGSHEMLEDIALARVLPRMVVISPCDAIEAKKATIAAARTNTPVYLRLARNPTPVVTTEETPFEIGKAQIFFEPVVGKPDVTIIATGEMVANALLAARVLEKDKIGVRVLNLATIKPLDKVAIARAASDSGAIVTVEDHQLAGGMGSAVAEFLATTNPVPMEFVAVHDRFGQSGTPDELIEHYGLGVKDIITAVKKSIKIK